MSTSEKTGRVFAGAKFTIKKPMDIAARILSRFKRLQIPVERRSPPSANVSTRSSFCIRLRITRVIRKPNALPTAIEPNISRAIFNNCFANGTD